MVNIENSKLLEVLFVDDETGILEQAKDFLEKEDERLKIKTTTSPKEALELLEENTIDAIVSDYKMPDMTGLELLRDIREGKEIDIPFIIFTGKGGERVALEALNLGADKYLRKGGDLKSQYKDMANAIVQGAKEFRKERERQQTETEILLDNFPAMFFLIDENNRVTRANQTFSKFLEKPKSSIEGRTVDDLFHAELVEKIKRDNQEIIESEDSKRNVVEKYIVSGETKWALSEKLPMEDEDGNITGVIVFARDITERKEAQEREEFLHSLLRHDLKNKTQIARGYLELLEDTELSEKQKKLVDKTVKAMKKGSDLIEKVRILRSLENKGEVMKIPLKPVIEEAINQNKDSISESEIDLKWDEFECDVLGGSLLVELFSNLIENSVKHSDCNCISISSEEEEEEFIVSIEDDGTGISDGIKEEIFGKGFKRGETEGSGLGLYLVKEIAERYGGRVEVKDSELGGARFDVRLRKA